MVAMQGEKVLAAITFTGNTRKPTGFSPAGPGSTGLLAEERSNIRKFTLSASDRLALLFLSQNVSIGLGCTGLPFVSLLKY